MIQSVPMTGGFEVYEFTADCGHKVTQRIFKTSLGELQQVLETLESFPCEPCRKERELILKPFEERK